MYLYIYIKYNSGNKFKSDYDNGCDSEGLM